MSVACQSVEQRALSVGEDFTAHLTVAVVQGSGRGAAQ